MLESALFYRRAFQDLELSDSNYKNCPNSNEWKRVEKISKFLKVFYDATLLFSGTHYPTASLYCPSIMECCITLKNAAQGGNEYLNSMAMHVAQISKILVIIQPHFRHCICV